MNTENRKIRTQVKSTPMQPNSSLLASASQGALIPRRVALYLRVGSFDQDGEKSALMAQERILKQYAIRHGWAAVARYADAAGGNDDRRPGLLQLMTDAGKGGFNVVLVHNYSKLYRNALRLLAVAQRLDKEWVKVISATQPEGTFSSEHLASATREVLFQLVAAGRARRK